jgi:predicted SnoaL-like aldol condensation-catalyzing enzyme
MVFTVRRDNSYLSRRRNAKAPRAHCLRRGAGTGCGRPVSAKRREDLCVRRSWAALLVISCSLPAPAAPLSDGPASTPAQEQASKLTTLNFELTLFGDRDPQKAADRYLATDFRNHDVEQPSGAQAFANYFLKSAEHGNSDPRISRPGIALHPLFAITDGDLTMTADANGGPGDPSARFTSSVMEIRNGRVTQMWQSGPVGVDLAPPPGNQTKWFASPGEAFGPIRVIVPNGAASRAQRDANKQLVEDFIQNFFGKGDAKAATQDLAPDIKSHVPGVPSGPDFAVIARKHQEKVASPDVEHELFALADGELVAVGFQVPYAGDLGARYAQIIVRVQGGTITEWWYSGYPSGHPRVWKRTK